MWKTLIKKTLPALLCISLVFPSIGNVYANNNATNKNNNIDNSLSEKEEFTNYLQKLFDTKNEIFFSGDLEPLFEYYDTSQNYGRYSVDHEIRRFRYLRDWASIRGIKFTEISSQAMVKNVSGSGDLKKIRVDEEYKFKYIYKDDENPIENVFGVALFHTLKLKKRDGNWKVFNDYYLDCFEDGLKAYNVDIKEKKLPEPQPQKYDLTKLPPRSSYNIIPSHKSAYNREKAAQYADRYSGVTWANGGMTPKYNKKYKNFTGIGGNCTNYVSQCLGDEEGGELKQGNGWHSVKVSTGGHEGSSAWVNADAFKNFLLYSGKGRLVKRGEFKDFLKENEINSTSCFENLYLGDVVSYAKKNDIDHNAIITGFDSHGYPLVNSHTIDRYHVPFDLGWGDKGIYFYLIHIR